MATESLMRMVEGSEAIKWSTSKGTAMCGSPYNNMAAEELALLLKGQRFHGDETDMKPNRSGSAPPSMEGSFAAIGEFLAQNSSILDSNLLDLSKSIENYKSEEQLRSDPAYLAYYCSNVNLNPRLPPPLMSQENRRLVHHIGGIVNCKPSSLDDIDNVLLQLSQSSLSTHKEEPDDGGSPTGSSENFADDGDASTSEQKTISLSGRHKSLVDLIQEDFPRTPSPVYQSRSSHATTEEPIDNDVHAISLDISSMSILEEPELKLRCTEVHEDNTNNDSLTTPFSSSLHSGQGGSLPAAPKNGMRDKMPTVVDEAPVGCSSTGLDISRIESRMRNKQGDTQACMKSMANHPFSQLGSPYQIQGIQTPMISQRMNQSFGGIKKPAHIYPNPTTTEVRPSFPSSGLTPAYYASPASYVNSGNPFYPNFPPSGLYTPQYGIGSYPLGSAVLSPFMAGYLSQSGMPLPLGTNSGRSFDGQNMGVSTGENNFHVSDMQHIGKLYGQHGMMLPSPFLNPLQMPYFQNNFGDVYNSSNQHGRLAAVNVSGSPIDSHASFMGEQRLQPSAGGNLGIPSPRRMGMTGGGYYGVPPSVGVMTQFPGSPLGSPVLPSSPIGGTSYLGRRNEIRFMQGSSKNVRPQTGWQGQRGVNSFDDHKRHSFIEELKSSNGRKFELLDLAGRIVEFSVDQHGSRFIQQKLENCTVDDKVSVFKEVLPHASKLMTDVFGNYVIQKFFEHGTPGQRRELADELVGQMLPLSLQMYGCRVIQKALEVIELDQKTKLAHELDGHVMRCVRDQNGNHVIQKCIECLPIDRIGFIIAAFRGQVATLSTHPYGCRVIQRVLDHGLDDLLSQSIVDEILESAGVLAEDQYGNYVTQNVLERGRPHQRSQVVSQFTGKIVQMCQHKYASNVIEKCLQYGDTRDRELLIDEIIGQSEENDSLLTMMKDQFANYVVQKIFDIGNDRQREILLNQVRVHLDALRKYTYGKHIVARFGQLFGEDTEASET